MNLKKYRSWEPHDEINLYSTMEGYLNKGTLVEYFSAVNDNQNGFGVGFANVPWLCRFRRLRCKLEGASRAVRQFERCRYPPLRCGC